MPHRFSIANYNAQNTETVQEMEDGVRHEHEGQRSRSRKSRMLDRLNSFSKFGHRRKQDGPEEKQDNLQPHAVPLEEENYPKADEPTLDAAEKSHRPSLRSRSLSSGRKVTPTLPRQLTFSRQYSEQRDRLEPVKQSPKERRAFSEDRQSTLRQQELFRSLDSSCNVFDNTEFSAGPEVISTTNTDTTIFPLAYTWPNTTNADNDQVRADSQQERQEDRSVAPSSQVADSEILGPDGCCISQEVDDRQIQEEIDKKWILNLSMHFRDKSDREKFFITYAQEPNRWRRLTVSCDYRTAEPDTLEHDLKHRPFQRDKSARIYESIRESLPVIKFLDTVTNLKLETEGGRLHVHVTEDLNEIIEYPSTSLFDHIDCVHYRESQLEFGSHLSGFVYKVIAQDENTGRRATLIKKEIPGPDTIDEFLYEVNALNALKNAQSVIRFRGLVVDEEGLLVKGILISYAKQGSLVDMLYNWATRQLPWSLRLRWARDVVQGLSEVHEAGFVQGDFTLSNIVIDANDHAMIIDINRRGCPVGWEPPELDPLIRSGQRIAMMIGVKTDIFQLGMVLWAIAEQQDEPERKRPFEDYSRDADPEVPSKFHDLVNLCLSERPQDRPSAKTILGFMDEYFCSSPDYANYVASMAVPEFSTSSHRSDKEHIDPKTAVERPDIEESRNVRNDTNRTCLTSERSTVGDVDPSTTGCPYGSRGSVDVARGRSRRSGRALSSPAPRPTSSNTSVSSDSDDPQWTHIRPDQDILSQDKRLGASLNSSFDQIQTRRDTPREESVRLTPETDAAILHERSRRDRDDAPGQPQPFSIGPHYNQFFDNHESDDLTRYGPTHQDSGFDEQLLKDLTSPQDDDMFAHLNLQLESQAAAGLSDMPVHDRGTMAKL